MALASPLVLARAAVAGGDVGALLLEGFPTAELCGLAADSIPHTAPVCDGRERGMAMGEGPYFSLAVSPGAITLRAADLNRAERSYVRRQDSASRDRLAGLEWSCACRQRFGPASEFEEYLPQYGDWIPCSHASVADPREGERSRIGEWSARSRARMVHAVACVDWRPMMEAGMPVMLTLTYSREWECFAPDPDTAKRHLLAMRRRYEHAYGPCLGMWKLEFQGRGAPHFHLLVVVPKGVTLAAFRAWCRTAWNRVVFKRAARLRILAEWQTLGMTVAQASALMADEQAKHAVAGASVDVNEGLRMRDPKRIAVYFMKHAAKGKPDQEYQHRVPVLWARAGGAGRFWGLWHMERVQAERYVMPADFVAARRLLRRWGHAQGRSVCGSGRLQGGWVLVNDGPAFAGQLGRALTGQGAGLGLKWGLRMVEAGGWDEPGSHVSRCGCDCLGMLTQGVRVDTAREEG